VWWFLAAFVLGSANFVWHLVIKGLAGVFTSLGAMGVVIMIFGLAFGLLLSAAILAYVWTLYRRGVLA